MLSERFFPRKQERGFSLVEMLVAAAIFTICAAVAFIFYSAAQNSYKSGENFSDQQQSTRVAFDRMISDIRLAGFNTNPDGDLSRIDEQVEGAWDTAVTVRGDFDFEDPTASVTPESSLPGAAYNVVSTGNDEIVTYVLAKPGPTGPDTLTLNLDPNRPRTKTNATVIIPNVALVQNDPPYTLYRVTLADVNGTFPGSPQASSSFVYEPVADNIKSMSFQYWPDSGAMLGPNTPTNTADDLAGADANSVTRSKIRRITVNLVGMTQDDDLAYTDATDATATTHYRKFDLQSDVNAENLGKNGQKDIDVTPPSTPTNVALVPGHCSGMLVKWDTPSSSSGVASYGVKYWPSGSPNSFTATSVTYPHQEFGVIDYDGHGFISGLTMGANLCFQVQARDLIGNQSGWAPGTAPCAVVANTTTPDTPQGLVATGNGTVAAQDSQITVNWSEVRSNSATLTGEPDIINSHAILRDGNGYKLYKDITSTFTPNDATNLVSGPPTLGNGVLTYTDANVANCQTYYYKLKAVDTCGTESAVSTVATGQAQTAIAPSKPLGLAAVRVASQTINLTWTPVTTKVNGTATFIDLYRIYLAVAPIGTLAASISPGAYTLLGTATTTAYSMALTGTDVSSLNQNAYYFTVSAADLCSNESQRSDASAASCTFNGTLTPSPTDASSGSGLVSIGLAVSGPDTYTRARVRIPSITSSGDVYDQQDLSYPFAFPSWNTSAAGPGVYTIHFEVENNQGCIRDLYTTFTVASNLACQISPTNPNLSPTNGKPASQNKKLSWDVVNNSGLNLDLTAIDVSWTNNIATHKLTTIYYPTSTAVTSFGTGATNPAVGNYSIFPLGLPASANGLCGNSTCVINMSLLWDTQIINTTLTAGELITIKYHFRDTYNATGTCTFTVSPDLSVAVGP